ncbi:MAG TPA: ketoacyl-ACP synthase III [Propionibacteriaceae bacterium]
MTYTILGTGSDLPEHVVSNHDIEADTHGYDRARSGQSLHEWVMERGGVSTRHRVAPGQGTQEMAVRASQRALADAGVWIGEVDLIVLSTFTPDARLPSTVSTVARELGANAKCIQVDSACTGFLDAMLVATSLMAGARYRTTLVVCVEAMSSVIDPDQFLYQTIFGDGAAAVVVQEVPDPSYGIDLMRSHTDAQFCDWTWVPGGGSKHPITAEVLADRSQYLSLDYKAIYRYAVEKMVDATYEALTALDLIMDDIDWLIPHQTGANIIADVVEQLKFPPERVISCLEHTGNVSGASVAIALDEAQRQGKFADGDRIVIPVVGAGMAWGAMSMVWRQPRQAGTTTRERTGS